ncbi:zinc finger BED domain-containing protein 4-like [Tachysurus ichikawai]
MKKAMDDLRVPSLGCVAHSLQLVVNKGLLKQRSISDVIASARKIVGHFKHSPLAYSRLQDLQCEFQMPLKHLQQNQMEQHILYDSEHLRTEANFMCLCCRPRAACIDDCKPLGTAGENNDHKEVEKMEKTLKRTATTATATDPAEMVSHAEASGSSGHTSKSTFMMMFWNLEEESFTHVLLYKYKHI